LLAACGRTDSPAEAERAAVPARAAEARSQIVPVTQAAPGTVEPRSRIVLASQINGSVREMRVRTGDRVRSGQVLAVLDGRDARSQKAAADSSVSEAESALSEARRSYDAAVEMSSAAQASSDLADQTYERYRKLFELRSVSPQEMDEVRARRHAARAETASRESMVAAAGDRIRQVEARLSQAQAQAGRADILVGYTRILAPESGIVVERSVDAGGAVFPGSPLLVLETTGRPQVLASLPAAYAGSLGVGMPLRVLPSGSAPPMEGRIADIVPRSDPATHSVAFKVDLPGDAAVVHGQYMKVEIPVGTREALLVGQGDLRRQGQLEGLFVVDDGGRARFRLVKTAPYDDGRVEILSGIEPGEMILVSPDAGIVDGMPVEITP